MAAHAARAGSKSRRGRPAAAPVTAQEAIALLRARAQHWVSLPNVTSVGVGHEVAGGQRTGRLAIQVTVETKLSKRELARERWPVLPETLTTADGRHVPVDVVVRRYKPSFIMVEAGARAETTVAPGVLRRRRNDPIVPGISISHVKGLAGTLGAIVFDNATGAACMLSNFHVLQGAGGALQDGVVQPGANDDGNVNANLVGRVLRSHVGLAGDCAVATIGGRAFAQAILELDVVPGRMARAEIGDIVVKSGRTTGVTRGEVVRVGVVVEHDYGGAIGKRQIGAFEIGPAPGAPSTGVLSREGDSGALWLIEEQGQVTDIAVGLHFALDVSMRTDSAFALACPIDSVCDKLGVTIAKRT